MGLIPCVSVVFSSPSSENICAVPNHLTKGYWRQLLRVSSLCCVKITHILHLMTRLRIHGVLPLLFMCLYGAVFKDAQRQLYICSFPTGLSKGINHIANQRNIFVITALLTVSFITHSRYFYKLYLSNRVHVPQPHAYSCSPLQHRVACVNHPKYCRCRNQYICQCNVKGGSRVRVVTFRGVTP